MKNRKHYVLDLFCGCGGFSKGFEEAGFSILGGIDIWNDALKTYQYNFPGTVAICKDLSEISSEELMNEIRCNKKDIDVIIGGPPCQGFSISGKRNIDDPRNRLYKSFVGIVKYVMPKIFVMENVPGIIRLFKGAVKEQILKDFSEIGYDVSFKILSADDYGVPQTRKRVFFIGVHKEYLKDYNVVLFPEKKCTENGKQKVTCEDAIGDLDFIPDDKVLTNEIPYKIESQNDYQKEMRKNSKSVFNHIITLHNEKTKHIISMVPDGGNYKDLPENLQSTRKVHIAWTRMNSKKPCFTIDTGHNHHFHYKENRVPTVREAARIQSFPDTFRFLGNKTSQLKQVGNAVPPLLAKALAEEIKKFFERENF